MSDVNGQLGLKENAEFVRACQSAGGRVGGLVCIHTTFTCSESFIRQAFKLGKSLNGLTHMHVSVGRYEPEHTLETHGPRTIAFCDSLGLRHPKCWRPSVSGWTLPKWN